MATALTPQSVGIAMCTPIPKIDGPRGRRLAPVTTEWHRARLNLAVPTNFSQIHLRLDGLAVDAARNQAVKAVMEASPRPEFLFFLDYDVLPSFDAVIKLVYRARHFPEHDMFAGVYCLKSDSLAEPLIYNDWGKGPFWDWAVGDLLTEGIVGIHMGLTLIRTSLFERMTWSETDPLFLTRNSTEVVGGALRTARGTEDLYFCKRAVDEVGAKILVDTSVLAGHINNATGISYGLPYDSLPVRRAHWLRNANGKKQDEPEEPELKAIDLGAGGRRREWPGYRTYTTDIRPDSKPDYVQDTRWLNLPDNEFDLVASSHHLEHFGRFEQEAVWKETVRILKPGGKVEHVLPNLMWAAHKIVQGETDGDTYNVVYGAQEAHGYERELNTHFMGFTPEVARAFAELAGLVDVEVKSYQDDPAMGYNMILTGRKPEVEAPAGDGGEEVTQIDAADTSMIVVDQDANEAG
jgi:predicted SAM-dependent methyltransferase